MISAGVRFQDVTFMWCHRRWHRRCHHCPWNPENCSAFVMKRKRETQTVTCDSVGPIKRNAHIAKQRIIGQSLHVNFPEAKEFKVGSVHSCRWQVELPFSLEKEFGKPARTKKKKRGKVTGVKVPHVHVKDKQQQTDVFGKPGASKINRFWHVFVCRWHHYILFLGWIYVKDYEEMSVYVYTKN